MTGIDTSSFVPIYEQIKRQLKNQIILGLLRPNQALPSIRDLATEFIINPNTVARAYRELEREGFIVTRKGRGCYVTEKISALLAKEKKALLNRVFDAAIIEALRLNLNREEVLKAFQQRLSSTSTKTEERNE